MIKTGIDIMFQEPTFEARRLRRAVVLEMSSGDFSIQFVSEPFAFEADEEVLMHFNGKREFMQQVGRIKEIIEPDPDSDESLKFTIESVGDAISAESRQNYRVSTISANLEASVGQEKNLKVQDLSSTGFSVLASESYQLGQTLEVAIAHEDEQCHGVASVQSIRELGSRRVRYGMRAIEEDPHTGEFLQVLQRISLFVQREQLQRSGGAD